MASYGARPEDRITVVNGALLEPLFQSIIVTSTFLNKTRPYDELLHRVLRDFDLLNTPEAVNSHSFWDATGRDHGSWDGLPRITAAQVNGREIKDLVAKGNLTLLFSYDPNPEFGGQGNPATLLEGLETLTTNRESEEESSLDSNQEEALPFINPSDLPIRPEGSFISRLMPTETGGRSTYIKVIGFIEPYTVGMLEQQETLLNIDLRPDTEYTLLKQRIAPLVRLRVLESRLSSEYLEAGRCGYWIFIGSMDGSCFMKGREYFTLQHYLDNMSLEVRCRDNNNPRTLKVVVKTCIRREDLKELPLGIYPGPLGGSQHRGIPNEPANGNNAIFPSVESAVEPNASAANDKTSTEILVAHDYGAGKGKAIEQNHHPPTTRQGWPSKEGQSHKDHGRYSKYKHLFETEWGITEEEFLSTFGANILQSWHAKEDFTKLLQFDRDLMFEDVVAMIQKERDERLQKIADKDGIPTETDKAFRPKDFKVVRERLRQQHARNLGGSSRAGPSTASGTRTMNSRGLKRKRYDEQTNDSAEESEEEVARSVSRLHMD